MELMQRWADQIPVIKEITHPEKFLDARLLGLEPTVRDARIIMVAVAYIEAEVRARIVATSAQGAAEAIVAFAEYEHLTGERDGDWKEVRLHSTDEAAIEATRNTIDMLGGVLVQDGERWYVMAGKRGLDFIYQAAIQQGYVLAP